MHGTLHQRHTLKNTMKHEMSTDKCKIQKHAFFEVGTPTSSIASLQYFKNKSAPQPHMRSSQHLNESKSSPKPLTCQLKHRVCASHNQTTCLCTLDGFPQAPTRLRLGSDLMQLCPDLSSSASNALKQTRCQPRCAANT